jgi:hypothetical protein
MPTHRFAKGALLQRSLLILGCRCNIQCWAVLYFYENPPVPILKHKFKTVPVQKIRTYSGLVFN